MKEKVTFDQAKQEFSWPHVELPLEIFLTSVSKEEVQMPCIYDHMVPLKK